LQPHRAVGGRSRRVPVRGGLELQPPPEGPPMTTDPFTDAAEDRVDELWPYAPAGFPLPPARRMDRRIGFRLGAQWARAHLAAQEPTDAEVEAATLELYVRSHHSTGRQTPFESLDHEEKVSWVEDGRAVLSAARAARRDEE